MPRPMSLREDELAAPGGRFLAIDDLEERGPVPESLMRKARPEVYAAAHGGMSPAQVDQLAMTQRMAGPTRDWLAGAPGPTMAEDEVELPGGGQLSIDDLEATGSFTPALAAKARPSVAAAYQAQSEPDRARERLSEMMSATQPRVDARRRASADSAQVARIIREEMPDATPEMVAEYMQWYRSNPRQFEREFYDFAADRREAAMRRQAPSAATRGADMSRKTPPVGGR